MIEIVKARPTPTTASKVVLAVSAAIVAGQLQYPLLAEPYIVHQISGTYSDFVESLAARPRASETFVLQVAAIYKSLEARQEPLGFEFEAAIFGDLESLYEA